MDSIMIYMYIILKAKTISKCYYINNKLNVKGGSFKVMLGWVYLFSRNLNGGSKT